MPNPFTFLWRTISNLTAIVALSSMTERFNQDFVQWRGFVQKIIEEYQNLAHSLLQFLPDIFPSWLLDYLIVGAIFNLALAMENLRSLKVEEFGRLKATKHKMGEAFEVTKNQEIHWRVLFYFLIVAWSMFLLIIGYIYFALVWPWRMIDHLLILRKWWKVRKHIRAEENADLLSSMYEIQWIATVILGTIIAFSISAFL